MKQNYKRFIVGALKAVFLSGLLFSFTPEAKACHGLPIVNFTSTINVTNITFNGESDASTCGCGPYYMQVELACNSSSFTNAPPVYTSPSWGTYPWFQSQLIAPVPNDACAQEFYNPLVIPFSQLCPGTTYYYRVREFVATGTNSVWGPTLSFTTPGLSPQLTAQVANSNQYTVCVGAQVQLNASVTGGCSGGYLYSWAPSGGLSNPNIANPVATISGPTTFTCTITDVCVGSPVSDTVQIQIGAPPVAGTASTIPSAICAGGSAMVILTGQQGNLQWQQSPDGINWFNIVGATNDTLNVGPLNSSLYYQAVVTGTGCGTSVSNITVVTVAPSPTVNAGPNITICLGTQDTLITTSTGISYSWSPSNSLNSGTAQSPLAAPTVTTTYTVTVTDGNGCTATDQVTVTVSTITANAGADITLCSGNQATILANANGAVSYSWSPSSGLSSPTVPNPVAGPVSTTTYVVTATNQFGCADNDTIVVNITPAPPISVSNDTAMCAGGIAQLVASGAQSYTWSPATGLSSTTIANPTASPLTTTTYIVVGNNGGCLDYDTVTVNITPPPAAFAGPDFAICIGAQGTLNATGGVQYTWSPTSTIIGSPNQASVTVAPTTTTTYSVVVVNQGGCISTDQITVTVNPLPTVTANSNDYTICAGSSANLSASGAAGYVWSPSTGLTSTISAVPSATPGNSTIYTVTGTDANGCVDTDTVEITIVPLPYSDLLYGNPTLCGDTSGTINIGAIIGGPGPYTYTVNGVPSVPNGNGAFGVYGAGTYTVVITDAAGCQGSGTAVIWVDASQLGLNASATPTIGVAPQFVNFYSSVTGGINNYTWDFGDGGPNAITQNPTYTYTQPGTYTVTVTGYNDNPACSSTDTLVIDIFPDIIVITPNVFTPNNDGMNDLFLSELQGVKDIKYTIYNRWGNVIREVEGLTTGWDGKNKNGSDVEDGTYYYVILATGYDDTTKEIAGFVQLIRAPK